ncbi:MAG: TetR/AcrR family transcriptional regulator [Steroidobacteraceae bacterium]
MLQVTSAIKPKRRPAGRPTESEAAALRSRILSAALEEFLVSGYGAASIEGIARAAGVNKDTIYRQFATKQGLYRASVVGAFQTVQRRSWDVFQPDGDVAQTLHAVLRRMHKTMTTPRALAVVSMTTAQAALFPELAAAARADTQEYLRPLADYLRKLRDEGVLSLDDPEDAAEMLSSNALGGTRFMYEPPLRGKALDEFISRRLSVLLRGWGYQPLAARGFSTGET